MALKTKERAVDTLKSIAKVLQGIYNKDIRIEILASRHGRVRVNITEKDDGGAIYEQSQRNVKQSRI